MDRLHLTAALLLAALAGCGGPAIPAGTATPHDGTLVVLPDGRGFAEILKRPDPSKEGRAQVVIYFLDGSRKPMNPAPTAARLTLQAAGAKPLDLQPAADSSLESPGFADTGEVAGKLSATIEGKEISVPIQVR